MTSYNKTGHLIRAPWAINLANSQIKEIYRRVECNFRMPREQTDVVAEIILAQESALSAAEVATLPCQRVTDIGREQFLAVEAGKRGVEIGFLETQNEVEPLRKSISNRTYMQQIAGALSERAGMAIKKVVAGLNTGNYNLISEAVESMTDDRDAQQVYKETMVFERNKRWIKRLTSYLDKGNAVIVVGAYHLPGEEGLINMLKRSGYRIDPTSIEAR